MKHRQKVLATLTFILFILIIIAGVFVYYILDAFVNVSKNPQKAFEKTTEKPIEEIIKEKVREEQQKYDVTIDGKNYNKKGDSVNIVLLGFDDVEDRPDDGGNTDSIIIFNIGFENNKMDMISIPRDTWTKVCEYDKQGNLEYVYNTKINAAYMASAKKDERYNNVLQSLEYLLEVNTFDIDIDYYCSIDIKDISKLCDAIDGVKITMDHTMDGIGKKGEVVKLNNETAEKYLRDRSTSQGDLDRTRRHREFLIGLLNRVKELGGKKAAVRLYDEIIKYTNTNLTIDQIIALASMADNIEMQDITMTTLPGAVGNASYERPGKHYGEKRSVYFPDTEGIKDLMLEKYYKQIIE